MKTYKIRLQAHTGTLTPFQADTIFGHLCWIVAYQQGGKGLEEFLKPFKEGNPPFLVSDGFPGDLLAKPLTAEINIEDPDDRKEMKRVEFLSLEDFNQVRSGKKIKPLIHEGVFESIITLHNTIDRQTNRTLSEGGIYRLEEKFTPNIIIYLKATSEVWKDQIVTLFYDLSKVGFGKKKSIGKGQFSVEKIVEYSFSPIEKANGFVTLSNFCPAENDPAEGLYKTLLKYGKLSEEFASCGNPFKRPLLMIKTGSVFWTGGQPKEFYGRIVQDSISPAKPEVVQYAYAFAVPIVYPHPAGG